MSFHFEPHERVGALGGTFDPLHRAHLHLADAAAQALAARPADPDSRPATHGANGIVQVTPAEAPTGDDPGSGCGRSRGRARGVRYGRSGAKGRPTRSTPCANCGIAALETTLVDHGRRCRAGPAALAQAQRNTSPARRIAAAVQAGGRARSPPARPDRLWPRPLARLGADGANRPLGVPELRERDRAGARTCRQMCLLAALADTRGSSSSTPEGGSARTTTQRPDAPASSWTRCPTFSDV